MLCKSEQDMEQEGPSQAASTSHCTPKSARPLAELGTRPLLIPLGGSSITPLAAIAAVFLVALLLLKWPSALSPPLARLLDVPYTNDIAAPA